MYMHFGTLHNLCETLPVSVLVTGIFDTNTQVDHNPFYEQIDRPVCGANLQCVPPNDTEAARFRANHDRNTGTWRRPAASALFRTRRVTTRRVPTH